MTQNITTKVGEGVLKFYASPFSSIRNFLITVVVLLVLAGITCLILFTPGKLMEHARQDFSDFAKQIKAYPKQAGGFGAGLTLVSWSGWTGLTGIIFLFTSAIDSFSHKKPKPEQNHSLDTLSYQDVINKKYLKRADLISPQENLDALQTANGREFNVQWGCDEPGEYDHVFSDHAEAEKEEFVEFRVKEPNIDTEHHWKIHISVDKDDLPQAWNLLFPILCQKAYAFKVVKLGILEQRIDNIDIALKQTDEERLRDATLKIQAMTAERIKELEEELRELERGNESRLSYEKRGKKLALPKLIQKAQESDCRRLAEENLQSREDLEKAKESILRLFYGQQITLYIPRGKEDEHQELIQIIEQKLNSNNIKQGQVYKTDKPMGQFCSIRHPGKQKYISGLEAPNYNPDNLPEPF